MVWWAAGRSAGTDCFPGRRALPGSGLGFTRQSPCPSRAPLASLRFSGSLEKVGSQHLGLGLGTLVAGLGVVCALGSGFGGPEQTVMLCWAPWMAGGGRGMACCFALFCFKVLFI